ncbi:Uncharacterized protein TCM_021409 [Theobroma cacao]|uniref:Secreted protein n=1 Tax=Theobroma cacao TaxID=3641 RepID=A0A061EQ54_THECC|nr:Uncharacterized protein TCM_021409 [Theobroma cacao]
MPLHSYSWLALHSFIFFSVRGDSTGGGAGSCMVVVGCMGRDAVADGLSGGSVGLALAGTWVEDGGGGEAQRERESLHEFRKPSLEKKRQDKSAVFLIPKTESELAVTCYLSEFCSGKDRKRGFLPQLFH